MNQLEQFSFVGIIKIFIKNIISSYVLLKEVTASPSKLFDHYKTFFTDDKLDLNSKQQNITTQVNDYFNSYTKPQNFPFFTTENLTQASSLNGCYIFKYFQLNNFRFYRTTNWLDIPLLKLVSQTIIFYVDYYKDYDFVPLPWSFFLSVLKSLNNFKSPF